MPPFTTVASRLAFTPGATVSITPPLTVTMRESPVTDARSIVMPPFTVCASMAPETPRPVMPPFVVSRLDANAVHVVETHFAVLRLEPHVQAGRHPHLVLDGELRAAESAATAPLTFWRFNRDPVRSDRFAHLALLEQLARGLLAAGPDLADGANLDLAARRR